MKALSMLGVTLFVTSTAFGAVNSNEMVTSENNQIVRAGIYKAIQKTEVDPEMVQKDGQLFTNLDLYQLSKDEAVAVHVTHDGMISVIYRASDDEIGKEADQLLLTQEQFAALNLKFDKDGGVEKLQDYPNFDILSVARRGGGRTSGEIRQRRHRVQESQGIFGNFGSDVANYGQSAGQFFSNVGTSIQETATKFGGKYWGCAAAVARRFGPIGKIGGGVNMVSAYLSRQPHLWMSTDPSSAIPGKTICSYSGGPRGSGDVATYVGGGRWEYRTSGKTHALHMSGFSLKNCATRR